MNPFMSLWAAAAVLGFAMVFSVPRRTLPGIAGLAVGAHLVRSFSMEHGMHLPQASFVAALAVGITAAVLAPRTNEATPIYAFAPVIPLIPGRYMFDALKGLIALTGTAPEAVAASSVSLVVANTATAALTVLALAVGTTAPGLLIGRYLARLGGVVPLPSGTTRH